MSDWEDSGSDAGAAAAHPTTKVLPKKPAAKKWQGEDDDDGGPVSDWENSESEEEEKSEAPPVAPPKKKGTLKAKLAEKEAAKAAKKSAEGDGEDDESDSDDVLDPRTRALRDAQREVAADMKNAAELFGVNSTSHTQSDLAALLTATPKTKEDFMELSKQIVEIVIKRHQHKPLYPTFVEQLTKDLAMPLRDVEIRKAASGLTTLANEKQREAKDKASGKKKKPAKPALGGAKSATKLDTNLYEEALDDFGTEPTDFM